MANNFQQAQSNSMPPVFQIQQQGPVSFNQPVQMQNFIPPQMQTQGPIYQAPQQIMGGMYGRRNVHNPIKHPEVFNDDEAIIERVK